MPLPLQVDVVNQTIVMSSTNIVAHSSEDRGLIAVGFSGVQLASFASSWSHSVPLVNAVTSCGRRRNRLRDIAVDLISRTGLMVLERRRARIVAVTRYVP